MKYVFYDITMWNPEHLLEQHHFHLLFICYYIFITLGRWNVKAFSHGRSYSWHVMWVVELRVTRFCVKSVKNITIWIQEALRSNSQYRLIEMSGWMEPSHHQAAMAFFLKGVSSVKVSSSVNPRQRGGQTRGRPLCLCSPLMLLRQVWGKIRRLWSRNHGGDPLPSNRGGCLMLQV